MVGIATSYMGPTRALRKICNRLGLAWWAKIDTSQPEVTYWFGPFLTKKSLNSSLPRFLNDLSSEGASSINHELIRCKKGEPLTK